MQGKKKAGQSKEAKAAEEVMEEEANGALSEELTKCLLNRDNSTIEKLLEKMGRMISRRASNISSGLSEDEGEESQIVSLSIGYSNN